MPLHDPIEQFLNALHEASGAAQFDREVNEASKNVPALPFYVRGNSGRLWECYEVVQDTLDKYPNDKSRWKYKARSVGNEQTIEDTLYALQLMTMYGLQDKNGNTIGAAQYTSPQEMFNGTGSDYDEYKNIRPDLAVKTDLN